jgi:hypothetical protein
MKVILAPCFCYAVSPSHVHIVLEAHWTLPYTPSQTGTNADSPCWFHSCAPSGVLLAYSLCTGGILACPICLLCLLHPLL